MEVTKIEKVTRVYKIGAVETKALRGVDLTIDNGEFTALLKENAIHHEYVETEGDHSWPVWRRYLTEFAPKLFR